ncbi:MAG: ABC transporter substrate-binding protein [Deltaproteobacteria bacterium]|jgi:branched-chain amino acid transport system substrate-binding protein
MKSKVSGKCGWAVLLIGVLFALSATLSPAMAKEVKLGVFGDVTGPIAFTAQQFWKGYTDYFKWIEKYDPIPGTSIKILMEDTGYNPKRYMPVLKKFTAEGISAGYIMGTMGTMTMEKELRKLKIPCVSEGSGYPPAIKPPGYVFLLRPLYPDFLATAGIHFMDVWKKAGHTEKPKLIEITWDVPYGRGCIELGEPWAQEYGFEVLPYQLFSGQPNDLSTQLLRAKKLGADLVYSNHLEGHQAVLLKDARRLGLQGKMQFCGGSECRGSEIIKLAGDAVEGAWSVSHFVDWSATEVEGIQLCMKMQKELRGELDYQTQYIMGVIPARITAEAIRYAAKTHGPENVNNQTIYEALTTGPQIDMLGLTANVKYGPMERRPYKYMHVSKCENGRWVEEKYFIEVPWLKP